MWLLSWRAHRSKMGIIPKFSLHDLLDLFDIKSSFNDSKIFDLPIKTGNAKFNKTTGFHLLRAVYVRRTSWITIILLTEANSREGGVLIVGTGALFRGWGLIDALQ